MIHCLRDRRRGWGGGGGSGGGGGGGYSAIGESLQKKPILIFSGSVLHHVHRNRRDC